MPWLLLLLVAGVSAVVSFFAGMITAFALMSFDVDQVMRRWE
jgi:hypothetical protein